MAQQEAVAEPKGVSRPELAGAPPPARPRVLVTGTACASLAVSMVFGGLLAVYLAQRAAVRSGGGAWLPEDVSMPLLPANMGLITLVMSVITMQWAVYSLANDDRVRTYLAFTVTLVLGVAYLNGMGFYYTQIGASVRTTFGALLYGITGAHIAMTIAGLLFSVLMAFRTLGGQYSARDREGVTAAALFWYVTVALYGVIWYAVFITK